MITKYHAAQYYRKQGFSVIPLTALGTEPLVPGQDYQQKIASPSQIEAWWEKTPQANVGIVTGAISGLVVIECASLNVANRFISAFPQARDTLVSMQGEDGNFYFEWTDGIGSHIGTILSPGINVKGEGGYVVEPPSIHRTRRQYVWFEWFDTNTIQPLPEELETVLTQQFTEMTPIGTFPLGHTLSDEELDSLPIVGRA
jgi:hypothetical protein